MLIPRKIKKTRLKSLEKANKGIPEIEQPDLLENKQGRTEEHRILRQKQWEEAYDKRRKEWYRSIIDAGGSEEFAEELAELYTPEAAKAGKPPKVVFGTSSSRTGLSKDGTKLIIRDGADVAEIKKKIDNLEHRLKRGKQLQIARYNRTKREAKMIGADLIKGEHSREEDLLATNPNFITGEFEWKNNCQRDISAYEARRRGIDVTAKPWITNDEPLMYSKGWARAYKNGKPIDCSDTTGLKARDNIIREIKKMPDGARCAVQVMWKKSKGGNGHVFIAENDNGNVIFIDPQPHGLPEQLDYSGHFNDATGELVYIMRLDNLKFSDIVKECCEKRKK